MGFITKKRKDAELIKPKDSIGVLMPLIFPKRTDSEVSMTRDFDVTNLCKYVDDVNKKGDLEFKMTYFHALMASMGIAIYNRPALNRFVKDKCLYQRKDIIFSFIAKNKMKDNGEEKIVFIRLKDNENAKELSKRMAVDVFKAKSEDTGGFDDTLSFLTKLPKWILSLIVKFVMFLDKKGKNLKSLTEGDTNYSTVIFSNLGSIKSQSCYHHLAEYGTNSIVITIGTIKEVNKRKMVDITFTIDERISDGFYFAKSVNLIDYIINNPSLLDKPLSEKVDYENQ
jgi:hypothetical protein